jgi:hypothetical protein
MTDHHLIAITTYGKQTIGKQKIPALKCGSGATAPVLLRLFGDRAREVTSNRASYRYIHIDGKLPKLRGGYLLLKLTETELDAAEYICRECTAVSSRITIWHEDGWLEFPTKDHDYQPAKQYGPDFRPLESMAMSLSDPDSLIEKHKGQIIAEYNQRDPHKPGWWWLTGDTYPHRGTIKRWGGRWSARRKAWYLIDWELPSAIRQLVDENSAPVKPPPEPQQPDDDDGLELMPDWLIRIINERRHENDNHSLDETLVFARLFMPDADWYLWVSEYDPKERRVLCYAILNSDTQMAEWGWQWVDDLEAVRGKMGLPMERDTSFQPKPLNEALDDWKRQRGLSDDSVPVENVAAHDHTPEVIEGEPEQPTGIRIIEPPIRSANGNAPDDDVLSAIQSVGKILKYTGKPAPHRPKSGIVPINQSFCGELTGDISGSVYCYGYATFDNVLVYLNMGGPRSSVEAIRAKLSKGQAVNLHPPDAPSIELASDNDADGNANTGRYTAFAQNISEARFMSMILLHEWITEPNFNGDSVTFIFRISTEQAQAQLLDQVRKLVNVAVFDDWSEYLWQAGTNAMLVRPARSGGAIDLLSVLLDSSAWTRLITGGIEQQVIVLPETTTA